MGLPTASLLALAAFAVGAALAAFLVSRLARRRQAAFVATEQTRLAAERARLAGELAHQAAALETSTREQLARSRIAIEDGLAQDRARLAQDRTRALAERSADEAAAQARRADLAERGERSDSRDAKLAEREAHLQRMLEGVDKRDAKLRDLDAALAKREQELIEREARRTQELAERLAGVEARRGEIEQRLTAIAGMTADEAKAELLRRLDSELVIEQNERIARAEKDYAARAKELGIEIVGRAIQRYAAEHTAETTVTKVKLADEEMKGRIIGKEGRNIKAFEQATGVDLIIDETPGTITISCFSGLRREMARRSLELLLEDGRVHPGRIEEVMVKVQQDMDREVIKLGEDAAFACDVSGLHPQLIRLLGKLQWRTSYGQNVLKHTQEVAFLCGTMAADLGLDPKLGRRCGLMHDIGKAIDHEQEGSHPELGYEALKRYGESEIVANAALAHHEGHAVLSAYTVLAAAADAISAARPGARSKNIEGYIKRLEQIEDIACSYHGVQKAYAIQAGRELRVIVSGKDVPDAELPKLARDIARRIEDEVAYPGEVKVTIIREMRHYAVAR
jgi:ribonuclease Y